MSEILAANQMLHKREVANMGEPLPKPTHDGLGSYSKFTIDSATYLHGAMSSQVTNHESSDTPSSSSETGIEAALSSNGGATLEAGARPDRTGLCLRQSRE